MLELFSFSGIMYTLKREQTLSTYTQTRNKK